MSYPFDDMYKLREFTNSLRVDFSTGKVGPVTATFVTTAAIGMGELLSGESFISSLQNTKCS
jgi:hypothetical protein